ncbi:Ribosome biogenesis protein NSA2 -like protein [Caligus rogercresseyi]|uniref:Ribosome biogenesis protein NSA2 -like protein n=1 Tax=Caligus rogercresseyi TaxID=217165 RepID=A0A7T8QVP8_CALRO|nr:Ribosome biogenesis protein NSA2 -like protein [Caligus rogercresseyi]
MPQNEHMELFRKRHGRRLDYEERKRKKEAREPKKRAATARKLRGLKSKLYNKERFKEKVQIKRPSRLTSERRPPIRAWRPSSRGPYPLISLTETRSP